MTGKDLLTAMSGIDGRYIEEAAPAAAPKTRSLRRPLLVAAAHRVKNDLQPFHLFLLDALRHQSVDHVQRPRGNGEIFFCFLTDAFFQRCDDAEIDIHGLEILHTTL